MYVSNTEDNVLSLLVGGNTRTVAGSLEGIGEAGDGGPATAATLSQPSGTAEDAAGNIYIADTEDNVIRKIDVQTGIITRIAGTGVAGDRSRGGQATRSELDAPRRSRSTPPATCSSRTRSTTGWSRSCATVGSFPSLATARLATRATGGGPLTRS